MAQHTTIADTREDLITRALRVFVTAPRLAAYLALYEPKALRQARTALAGGVEPLTTPQAPRTVTVYSADGIPFYVEFHREEDRCWRCQFPRYTPAHKLNTRGSDDLITDTPDGPILHSGSLARVLTIVAEQILHAEF